MAAPPEFVVYAAKKQTIDLSESPRMSDFTGRAETDGAGGGKSGSDH